jgi:hypothetical protein
VLLIKKMSTTTTSSSTLRNHAQQIRDESLSIEASLKEKSNPEIVLGCFEDLDQLIQQLDLTRTKTRQELKLLQRFIDDVKTEDTLIKERTQILTQDNMSDELVTLKELLIEVNNYGNNNNSKSPQLNNNTIITAAKTRHSNSSTTTIPAQTIYNITQTFHNILMLHNSTSNQLEGLLLNETTITSSIVSPCIAALQYLGSLSKQLRGNNIKQPNTNTIMEPHQFLMWSRIRIRELCQFLFSRLLPNSNVDCRGDELSIQEWQLLGNCLQICIQVAYESSTESIRLDDVFVIELCDLSLLKLCTSALAVEPKVKNEILFCDGVRKISHIADIPSIWELVNDAIIRRCKNFISCIEKENVNTGDRVREMIENILPNFEN